MMEVLLSDLLENIKKDTDADCEVVISDRLFSYSFVDGKIESDMIKYIYSG